MRSGMQLVQLLLCWQWHDIVQIGRAALGRGGLVAAAHHLTDFFNARLFLWGAVDRVIPSQYGAREHKRQ